MAELTANICTSFCLVERPTGHSAVCHPLRPVRSRSSSEGAWSWGGVESSRGAESSENLFLALHRAAATQNSHPEQLLNGFSPSNPDPCFHRGERDLSGIQTDIWSSESPTQLLQQLGRAVLCQAVPPRSPKLRKQPGAGGLCGWNPSTSGFLTNSFFSPIAKQRVLFTEKRKIRSM